MATGSAKHGAAPVDVSVGNAEPDLLLREGEMQIEGRLVEASNITLRVTIGELRAVYKPSRGERPLWDFPGGSLAGREVAAYELSRTLGWDLVPPTVLRDGPLGMGSCQLWLDEQSTPPVGFVPADQVPGGWLPVASARDDTGQPYLLAHADEPALARLALFDVISNNADRKGGHVLARGDGRLFGVDHGVCFHAEDKLRTVLWGFAGRPVAQADADLLRKVDPAVLGGYLTAEELDAVQGRIKRLLGAGVFPQPPDDRHAIPWPPM